MLHSRPDYMRIQDPSSLIPQDEPVFLLRAQDKTAALVVEVWAAMQPDGPLALMAKKHAEAMRVWEDAHPARMKWADITPDQRNEVHGPHPIGGWKPLPNAPVGGVVRDLERRLEAMSLSHAGRIAELERCKNELDDLKRQHYRLQRSFDTERAACNDHVLTIGNMRLSATSAGCIEVEACRGCGNSAPCPHHPGCGTEKRFVNKTAEEFRRERDSLRAELSTERRSHNQRMAALVTLKFEFDTLKRQLSRSNHNMDATGQCSANCPACEEVRRLARAETADAPNMCRDGHPEIRYEQGEDAHGCPLCRALSRLSSWERKMPCGHPEAALMVDDPPYCAVCNQQFEINKMVNALRALKLRIHFIGWPAEAMVDRGDGVMVPDWRNEIKILEDALAGHGGADDHPLNRYIGGTHADH